MNAHTFGIDLGTTNSVAAVYKNGQIDVLASPTGSHLFPSYVCYSKRNPSDFIIGEFAKVRMRQPNLNIVVHDCKRLMGVDYDNPIVKRVKESVAFDIEDDGRNIPEIVVNLGSTVIRKHPEDIGAMVLKEIADRMKEYMGNDINDVVITVPAYFNQRQRELTKAAGEIAGLNVVQILTEPEAAAYAYLDQREVNSEKTVMVYDLGGGTFDVTLLHVCGNRVEELALNGDVFLGGSDLDMMLLEKVKEEYLEVVGEPLPPRMIPKMRVECEQAKISLTALDSASIPLTDGQFFDLSRAAMNHLFKKSIERTLDICDETLRFAKVHPEDLDQILFVGGSTRMVLVKTLVSQHYPNAEILQTVNPDECVAYGAAKFAQLLEMHAIPESSPSPTPTPTPTPPPVDERNGPSIGSICPSDIGLKSRDRMLVLIKRYEKLPTEFCHLIRININEPFFPLSLYQGNDEFVANNTLLKRIRVSVDPTRPIFFKVTLKMDSRGSLSLHLVDYVTGKVLDYNEIQAVISKEDIANRGNALKQEYEERERTKSLDMRKNELNGRAEEILNNEISEADRAILEREKRLFVNTATSSMTEESFSRFSQLCDEIESRSNTYYTICLNITLVVQVDVGKSFP